MIRIISVRKNTQKNILEAENTYLKRMTGKLSIDLVDLRPKTAQGADPKIKQKQMQEILEKVGDDILVTLDETGKQLSSIEFSQWLDRQGNGISKNISFVIGPADGLDKEILNKSTLCIGLSRMTWPHELARLLLIEQIYRAREILQGSSYHKK